MTKLIFQSPADLITIILASFSSLFALLLAFKQFLIKNRTSGDISLGLLMLTVFLWRLSDVFEYLELFNVIINPLISLRIISSIGYYHTSPLVYFYGKYYISDSKNTVIKIIPHFILPWIMTLIILGVSIASLIYGTGDELIIYFDNLLEIISTAIISVYIVYIILRIIFIFKRGTTGHKSLLFITGIMSFLLLCTIASFSAGNKLALSICFAATLVVFFLMSSSTYKSLIMIREEAEQRRYAKSHLRDMNVDFILERISELMDLQKIYRNEAITLSTFADMLKITSHQLSEILNSKIGLGFFPYINMYRINEAKEILERDKDVPVIKIAYQVGFNSLSSFYTAFKKSTGLSPGTYQKLRKK